MSCNRISKEDWNEIQVDGKVWVVLDNRVGLIGIFSSRRKVEAFLTQMDKLDFVEVREWSIE